MLKVGERLGSYTLLKRLGKGRLGEVFLASKPGPVGFGPGIVLRVLRDSLAKDPSFVEALVRDANTSMFLNHQNVVPVLDLSEDQGRYYIASDYVQGINLAQLLDGYASKGGVLALPIALFVTTELARALKYAHSRVNYAGEPLNIVHGDLDPKSVFLSVHGDVKLADFGFGSLLASGGHDGFEAAKANSDEAQHLYTAPEVGISESLDARADLFSLGVLLYTMAVGFHPAAWVPAEEARRRFANRLIAPPSQINPELPPALDGVVMRCLEPNPTHRFSTAAVLVDALQDIVLSDVSLRQQVQHGATELVAALKTVAPSAFDRPVSAQLKEELLQKAQAESTREAHGFQEPRSSESVEVPTTVTEAPDISFGGVDVHHEEDISQGGVTVAEPVPFLRDETRASFAMPLAVDPEITEPPDETHGHEPVTQDGATLPPTEKSAPANEVSSRPNEASPGREELLEEPVLPGAVQGRPPSEDQRTVAHYEGDKESFPFKESKEDQRTTIGYGPDSADASADDVRDERTMAMPAIAAEFEQTLLGLEEHGPATDEGQRPEELSDPHTLVPTGEKTQAVEMTVNPDDWANARPQSVTLLQDAQRKEALGIEDGHADELAPSLKPDIEELPPEERTAAGPILAPILENPVVETPALDMDRIVMDSIESGRHRLVDPAAVQSGSIEIPHPVKGPIQIPLQKGTPVEEPAPDAMGLTQAHGEGVLLGDTLPPSSPPPDSAAEVKHVSHRAPVKERVRIRPAKIQVEPAPKAPAMGFGSETGRWMAGQLDAGALEWSDDAAARRAIATRNMDDDEAALPTPSVVVPGGDTTGPGTVQTAAPRSFVVYAAPVFALVALGLVVYIWAFTPMLWPRLKLESTPPAAKVMVDGKQLRRRTPVSVRVAPDTKHLIEFKLKGYRPETRPIKAEIARGRTYIVRARLSRVSVLLLPVEAEVRANGIIQGQGKKVRLGKLPAKGPIVINVLAPGYDPYELVFDTVDDLPPVLDVPLKRSSP